MKNHTTVYSGFALCALSLALAGCLPEDEKKSSFSMPQGLASNASTVQTPVSSAGTWTVIRQNQLVGGASGICSSAGQGACEDWNAWAAGNLTPEQIANSAVAVTEPIELSEAKIAALVADPSWAEDEDFQTGVELILNYLRGEIVDGDGVAEYDDWSDFRAAFLDVANSDVDGLPEGIDGDVIWFDSTSAQYATFESLKKADERLNYTVDAGKVAAAKAVIAGLPADTLDEDQQAINEVLDSLESATTRNQDELLAAIRAFVLNGEVLGDGAIWDTMDEDDWYDILLYETSTEVEKSKPYDGPQDQTYQISQAIIDAIAAADWWVESEGAQTVAILQHLLDENEGVTFEFSSRDAFRDAFMPVLLKEGFENGGQLWNSLSAELRFRLMEELVDDIADYERPIEYVSHDDTRNRDSVTIIEDFIAKAKVAGNTDTPKILVMTSSAANSYEAADYYVGMFTHEGATAEWLPLDRAYRKAHDANQCDWLSAYHSGFSSAAHLDLLYPDYFTAHMDACENGLAAMIDSADGIFINGGDQVRTFDALVTFNDGNRVDSAELTQILARHAAGELVIGGTSAGAAVQAGGKLNDSANTNPMVTAGSPHGILKNGYTANSAELTGGMGIFDFGVTDTHFSERARETRLIRLVEHGDVRFGFGVDETTALNVRHEKDENDEERVVMTVSGRSGVYIVDYDTATTIADAPFETRGVTTHYLNAGDSFVWYPATETYVVHVDENRTAKTVASSPSATTTSSDILYQTEYVDMATALFMNGGAIARGTSDEDDPEYRVELKVNSNTRAFQSGDAVTYTYVEVELSHDNNY
ncbi:cyanophycinase [Salinispirillum sp. LH 10-3-1]|uniref:Cyanophycinase n=1 Tax=Salinispirillum sp. LH 10-3-1 TaxID=2952525 RepID=A0AB38YC15_9GAMM